MINLIKENFEKKNYKFFDSDKAYNLNIFSVRTSPSIVNQFDDYIFCVYKDKYNRWRIHQWECTTDPGAFYLKNPMKIDGTAILVPGQYINVYAIDKHKGEYDALCQRLGDVKVYRDSNRDGVHDFDPNTIQEGRFGINIHNSGHRDSKVVEKWSAGCTVFRVPEDFEQFMYLCKIYKELYGNQFTYTLFNEEDFKLN